MTKDEILQRMLDNVPDALDKREGSVIYDALAPVAYEMEQEYIAMEKMLANTYARTADRDGLILRAEEIGLVPFPATYAIRKGVFTPSTLEIAIGERFNYETLNFKVIEKISTGTYKLQCESIGAEGNLGAGMLLPINYVQGLETATLTDEVLIYGEDEESTEDFRKRYFDKINSEAQDGNVAQYKKWAAEYPGIGNAKVFPLWNGANTVKVSILNTENGLASSTLISDFQEYLDPGSTGLGNGVAPIGAIVTVSTATATNITVSGTITLADGYTEIEGLNEDIEKYFKSISYSKSVVSLIGIGSVILNNASVDNVSNLKINNGISDVTLGDEKIPVLYNADWTVAS